MSNSLRPNGLQHARLPSSSPTPGACSNSCPSVMPSNHLILCHSLLLLPSISPTIRVFPNASVLHIRWPKYWSFRFNTSSSKDWFPLGLTGLVSLQSKRLSRVISNTTIQKHQSKAEEHSAFFMVQLSHPNTTIGKTIPLTIQSFVSKVMSLLFNMLSRLVIAFLPRSKHLLTSWLQSPSTVILEPPKIKCLTVSIVPTSICYEVMGPDAMTLVFWIVSFKPTFSLSSFTFIKRLFSSS